LDEPKILKYFEYTHKLAGYINITILEQNFIASKKLYQID